jgi:hypothetical protein
MVLNRGFGKEKTRLNRPTLTSIEADMQRRLGELALASGLTDDQIKLLERRLMQWRNYRHPDEKSAIEAHQAFWEGNWPVVAMRLNLALDAGLADRDDGYRKKTYDPLFAVLHKIEKLK